MKPSIIKSTIVLAMALLPLFSFGKEQITKTENETFVENEFIIWLEQGVDAATFSANSNVGISPKRMLSKRLNIWLFEITDKAESREVKMERLWKDPDVRVIQNNHTNITLREAIPDDPYFGQQWAPAIMSLPQAWDEFTTSGITATGDTIVVAVIDGGADWTHEDLNCWINTREIPNNGIDDDGNGYVDDYRGWNAYNHNGYVGANHHGTHVSGIIGAVGDNGKGVCGVNGLVEAAEFLKIKISDNPQYEAFVQEVLGLIEKYNKKYYSKKDGLMFNCEMIPAENVGVKHAKWDKEDGYEVHRDCYNSYFYIVEDPNTNVLDKFRLHGEKYIKHLTGGSALHCNLEEHLTKEQYRQLLRVAAREGCNYFTFNIPNTICNDCGHIDKRFLKECPECHSHNIDYLTRIIGYLKRVSNFSEPRQEAARRHYGKMEMERC